MPTERKVFRDDIHLGHKVPTVDTDDLVNGCVTEEKLADNSVSTRTIQDEAVTTPKIADDAVTTPKIKDDAVTTPKIKDENVTTPKLNDEAVTTPKIKNGAVNESKISPDAVTTTKIKDENVTAPKLARKAVTPEKISDDFKGTVVAPYFDALDQKYKNITDELYTMIRSLVVGGLALSDRLGPREDIGITQKAITDAINALNGRIDDIAGVWTQGFSMVVTPDTFISEDSCQVNISATASAGVFDHIAFYADNELLAEGDQIATLAETVSIDDSCVIKCVASILGREYIKSKVVTKYFPFFIGGGNTLDEALVPENARELHDGSIVYNFDVVINDGQKIFVLVPASLTSQFIRFDMNGYEIPMLARVDGDNVIYESQNTYQAGTYNIDITDNRDSA